MNALEWRSFTRKQREQLLKQWAPVYRTQETPLHAVVRQIAEELESKYRGMPEVTSVRAGADPSSGEPLLLISTIHEQEGRTPELPSRIDDIRVLCTDLSARSAAYVRAWDQILERLLHWSQEKRAEWIAKWDEQLHGKAPIFYHRGPVDYISSLVVQQHVDRISGGALVDLRKEVERILTHQNGRTTINPADDKWFNWEQAARELQTLFERHRGTEGGLS